MAASRVHVTLSAAMSIDGKIATRTRKSSLSSQSDLARVHKLRARHDAIMVGINTIKIDDPLLTVRRTKGKNPVRIILDSNASLPRTSRIAKTSQRVHTILVVSPRAPKKRLDYMDKIKIETIPVRKGRTFASRLLSELYSRGIRSVLLEGGGTINWEFARLGLIDDAVICITPRLVGGSSSTTLVDGTGFARIADSTRMRLRSATRYADELVMRYSKL